MASANHALYQGTVRLAKPPIEEDFPFVPSTMRILALNKKHVSKGDLLTVTAWLAT